MGVENGLKRVNGLLVFAKVSIVLLVIAVGCTKALKRLKDLKASALGAAGEPVARLPARRS